jgi:hypothetical protein
VMADHRWTRSSVLTAVVALTVVLSVVFVGSQVALPQSAAPSTPAVEGLTRAWPAPVARRNVVMSMAYNYPLQRCVK